MPPKINMTGLKCGRLTVIREHPEKKDRRVQWLCKCECGNSKVVSGKHLRNGDVKSCGCLHIEKAMRHVRRNEKPLGHERINNKGYVLVKTEKGFEQKHVYVVEKRIGRKLRKHEVVHHIDHDKTNNSEENLTILTAAEHNKLHHVGAKRSAATRLKISIKAKARVGVLRHPCQKLTTDEVKRIREEYQANINGYSSLAKTYGVTRANIRNIVKRKTWRYVA